MTKIILNSGGMDSFFVATLFPKVDHVFVDIGQRYGRKELKSARRIAEAAGAKLYMVIAARIAQFEHPSGIIPLRNAELLLCAAQYGEDLYMGILSNEINSDKSPEFLRAMELVMNISCQAQYWSEGRNYRIHTPLGTKSKTELVADIIRYHGEKWPELLATVSCYNAGDTHCGACASCFKRWVALTAATGMDANNLQPGGFDVHPATQPLSYWEAKGYPEQRIAEIRAAYRHVL